MKRQTITKIVVMFFAVLLICATTSIMALAATNTSAYVSSNTEVSRGEEITFTVGINNGTGIQAIMIVPEFDSNAFELVSGSWTLTGGLMSDFSVSTGDGVIAFGSGISVNNAVLNFTLKAKDNAALGAQTVSAEVIVTDSNGNSTLTTSSSSVQIKCNHNYSKQDFTYIKSEATCTSPAVYYKSCINCGAKGTETFKSGNSLSHSYTRQAITDAYKKSGASCTAKAVYYYCCATCDAKGTETYEYGTKAAHSYTRQVISDTYKVSAADCDSKTVYNYCCATCDKAGTTTFEYGSILGHTGGTATCTAKAECTRCHQQYGSTLAHIYTDEDATATYLKSAATCTSKAVYYKNCATCDKAGTTTFEYGTVKAHSYTEKIANAYLKASATCTSKAIYYKSCSVCGTKGTDTFEVGDTPSHNYQTTWKSNETSHWHECSVCKDKKDIAAHTPGAEATETTAQSCTTCGYIITPALGHKHSYATSWTTDDTGHWYACSGCEGKGSYAAHDFENDCDKDCSICGYTRETEHKFSETWTTDANNHWHICSGCGLKQDEAAHEPGAEATATTAQTCTVCGYEIAPALGSEETKEPTESADATTPATPTDKNDPDDENFPWWIIIVVTVIAVVGIVAVNAIKKKKA